MASNHARRLPVSRGGGGYFIFTLPSPSCVREEHRETRRKLLAPASQRARDEGVAGDRRAWGGERRIREGGREGGSCIEADKTHGMMGYALPGCAGSVYLSLSFEPSGDSHRMFLHVCRRAV